MADDEARVQREKDAVTAMRSAKSHMEAVLNRCARLEGELRSAAERFEVAKRYIGESVTMQRSSVRGNETVAVKAWLDECAAAARAVL